jgi:hypothetical protein
MISIKRDVRVSAGLPAQIKVALKYLYRPIGYFCGTFIGQG